MIIRYLVLSIFGALLSGVWALLAGFDLWAVFGFYALGGSLSMIAAVSAVFYWSPHHQPTMMAA
jgi:hypothetical protein